MKRVIAMLMTIVLLAGVCACAEPATSADEAWALVRQAYIYGFPLMLMDATLTVGTNVETPETG